MQERINAWRRQLSFLTDAYLAWKHEGPPGVSEGLDDGDGVTWSLPTMSFTGMFSVLEVSVADYYTNAEHGPVLFTHAASVKSVNETLVRYGFLGASPEKPTIAFSFSLFDIYRQLHWVCPHFSIDALSKSLSHLHHVSYHVLFYAQH